MGDQAFGADDAEVFPPEEVTGDFQTLGRIVICEYLRWVRPKHPILF
jgi:hypothetical protein